MSQDILGSHWPPFEVIEDQFNQALEESLDPRGPEMLFDYVAQWWFRRGACAIDIGCDDGYHADELRRRFSFNVLGIDPNPIQIEIARHRVTADMRDDLRFEVGRVENIPAPANTFDLVWCRDVLELVDDLPGAYREIYRVLKPGGKALIYVMCATDLLEPHETSVVFEPLEVVESSMRPPIIEAAIRQSGLHIDACEVLGTEWGEAYQEQTGKPGRNLLHLARLLRQPDRYVQQFGRRNYEIKVADCLWHVYRLVGKLSSHVYLLSKP